MISKPTIGQIIYMSIRFTMSKNANIGEKAMYCLLRSVYARDGIILSDFLYFQ